MAGVGDQGHGIHGNAEAGLDQDEAEVQEGAKEERLPESLSVMMRMIMTVTHRPET